MNPRGYMIKCSKPNIVYGASSALWGFLGFYVSSVFAIDIIAELHSAHINSAISDIIAEPPADIKQKNHLAG